MTLKRDHEACEEHNVIIERIKVLEKLPSLFSWMNITKGVGFLLVVMLTILFGITMTTRSELFEKQKEQEKMQPPPQIPCCLYNPAAPNNSLSHDFRKNRVL